ncbi:hypothetical protein [Streptomyces pseudogriseolus]|uniref:hypothetical protein n=1 Tax=Streptomyces pseudogriseolus TaxID=36817 RepID=UPI003FA1C92E
MSTPAPPLHPLEAILAAGLEWLYDVRQPDDALLQSGSRYYRCGNGRSYYFRPSGPGGRPVIVVKVTEPRYEERRGRYGAERVLTNPLAKNELEELAAVLERKGRRVHQTWNGHPSDTGSICLEDFPNASLVSAVFRYRSGCPIHRSVFCSREKGCTWYGDGHGRLIEPDVAKHVRQQATTTTGG